MLLEFDDEEVVSILNGLVSYVISVWEINFRIK